MLRIFRKRSNEPGASGSSADEHLREAAARIEQGDGAGAEQRLARALALEPGQAHAHYLLGSLLGQRGELDAALGHLEQSLRLAPDLAEAHAAIGNVHRAAGRADAAERSYREALAADPACAMAHLNLCSLLGELGRADEAVASATDAARALPELPEAQFMAADLLAAHGRYREAASAYRDGIARAPEAAAAHCNLGATYRHLGSLEEAKASFAEALRLDPALAEAHDNLADMLAAEGRLEEAARHFERAAEIDPRAVHPRRRLANLHLDAGRHAEAVALAREVLALAPEEARAQFELGNALAAAEQTDEAIERLRTAIRLDPDYADAHVNLGYLLNESRRTEEALRCFERALEIEPDSIEALNNLGGVLQLQARLEPAIAAYRRALALDPDALYVRSNLLTCLNYDATAEPEQVFAEHLRWAERVARPHVRAAAGRARDLDPRRRLRVGYVSADFRFHSVSFFIAPVIEQHDREKFEIFCYANVARPDANTRRLEGLADHWRDVSKLDDEELAAWIRRDEIDVLVDLSGHTLGNRLAVFARRPAPVQVTYLGYPNTTGLACMDYRLTDHASDPEGLAEQLHTETLVRLPHGFLAFQPLESCPEIRSREGADGEVVFGCFNELLKITPHMVECWCGILRRMPGARLIIKGTSLGDEGTRERVREWFRVHDVADERVELIGRTPTLEAHLEIYNRVDVALDTFPYNGTTTTCEALWMGVPVVTLCGRVHASRVGASLLGQLGLEDLVCKDMDGYAATAIALASDAERRRELRTSLRRRMRASSLMDELQLTRDLESAYREMWRRYCEQTSSGDARGANDGVTLELHGDVIIRVPDDLNQLTPYVLLEQEDWFEDEIDFVRRFLGPGMRCLDIGANHGVFTLNFARRIGPEGHVWSFEPTRTTYRALGESVAANGFDNVTLIPAALAREAGTAKFITHANSEYNRLGDEAPVDAEVEIVDVASLDGLTHELGLERIDFVKLDAEGAECDIVAGGASFMARESPLVMFEFKHGDAINDALIDALRDLGYAAYRLVPGLGLLVPFARDDLDAFQLNLFAAKPQQAARLEAEGLLVARPAESGDAAELAGEDYLAFLAERPYARARVDGWREAGGAGRGAPAGLARALSLYSAAHGAATQSRLRHAALETALEAVVGALEDAGPDGRAGAACLHSLARVAWELGRRERALAALDALVELAATERHVPTAELPFLAVSAHFDALDPEGDAPEWSLAAVLDQRERLCAFSSYLGGESRLAALERLAKSRFALPEMERRRQLVRLRAGLQSAPERSALLAERSELNLNAWYWRGEPRG
ncbi:MAG: FkbM family methyltransferase [Gammaproteobacteria bacterium]|nr:FkbM family methyltransferase [Gammaproteobacteria bacterium]